METSFPLSSVQLKTKLKDLKITQTTKRWQSSQKDLARLRTKELLNKSFLLNFTEDSAFFSYHNEMGENIPLGFRVSDQNSEPALF